MNVIECELEPDPEVIERLEEFLEMAKAGDVQGLVLVGVNRRGEVSTAKAGWIRTFSMVGAREAVKTVVLAQHSEHVQRSIQMAAEE